MGERVHWADVCAAAVPQDIPHRIATGITPSGPIHIGNMREVVTGDLIFRAMIDAGLTAELLYIADDFDPLRRVYPFLPQEYSQYVGMPICDIPCPCGEHANYAEHFLAPFLQALDEMAIHPVVVRGSEEYRGGRYTEEISTVLEHTSGIREILERVSGRSLPPTWTPYYPVCGSCGRISNAVLLDHDRAHHRVSYRCACGYEGVSDYARGEGKLVWRVDWPMRWYHFGITVEPFGKDHAASGGSYDTGSEIVRKVFGREPPFPVMYEWISLKGKGAMASSTGVAVTIEDMLRIVPPDVLRYLIARSRPEKAIDFDPGMGLVSLIDEFERGVGQAESREFALSRISTFAHDIPFRHMITVVQIARTDAQIFEILQRSGYDVTDREGIFKQAQRARAWLESYAPEEVRFSVQESLPAEARALPGQDLYALGLMVSAFSRLADWKADALHALVYSVAEETGTSPREIFRALYIVFLGKERGARMGWFLEALGREFVERRIIEAVNAGGK